MPVFLIGFMSSGKSTAGQMAANLLGYRFTDLDDYITLKYNMTINEIFTNEGEHHFRLLEQESLRELSQSKNMIIATGGGCPCFSDNMNLMNENGETIFLKTHRGTLYSRLVTAKMTRPLIAKLNDVALMKYIMDVLPEREFYYKKAKHTIEIINEFEQQIAEKITAYVKTQTNIS